MNVNKLVEAIQIIVKEEVRKERNVLINEIKSELNKLKKHKQTLNKNSNRSTVSINEILNETSQTYAGAPNETDEWTIMSNPSMVNAVIQHRNGGFDKTSLAEKLGYGDMGGASSNGLGVDTGNSVLNKVLNRDYTELVRAMDNIKNK